MAEGFGTSFIRRSVEYELGGRLGLELSAAGLRCLIEFPLRRNLRAEPSANESMPNAQGIH
jgi:two-component system CheB/CheR fusion protein